MLPSELLDIEEELPEPAIFIAVPDEPADIVPVLLIVVVDPPSESITLTAIESA